MIERKFQFIRWQFREDPGPCGGGCPWRRLVDTPKWMFRTKAKRGR